MIRAGNQPQQMRHNQANEANHTGHADRHRSQHGNQKQQSALQTGQIQAKIARGTFAQQGNVQIARPHEQRHKAKECDRRNEQRFTIRTHGDPSREIVDFEGLLLVRIPTTAQHKRR